MSERYTLPVGLVDDPMFRRLSPRGVWCALRCFDYCARFDTDGRIPVGILEDFEGLKELHKVGYLRAPNGRAPFWIFALYLKTNRSSEQLANERERARKRMARKRGKSVDPDPASIDEPTGPPAPSTSEEGSADKAGRTKVTKPPSIPAPVEPRPDDTVDTNGEPPAPMVGYLADVLADCIAANGVPRPRIGKRWYQELRMLTTKDGFPPEVVEKAIRWAQNDSFWRANILSPVTLRRHMVSGKLLMLMDTAAQREEKPGPVYPTLEEIEAIRDGKVPSEGRA